MRREVVMANHYEFGHFALEKPLNKLRESYWFPDIRKYVEKYIAACSRCLFHSAKRQTTPLHTVHIDHLRPFNKSSGRKRYVLILVEPVTKFAILIVTNRTRALRGIFNTYGVPTRIITALTSRQFKVQHQARRNSSVNTESERTDRAV